MPHPALIPRADGFIGPQLPRVPVVPVAPGSQLAIPQTGTLVDPRFRGTNFARPGLTVGGPSQLATRVTPPSSINVQPYFRTGVNRLAVMKPIPGYVSPFNVRANMTPEQFYNSGAADVGGNFLLPGEAAVTDFLRGGVQSAIDFLFGDDDNVVDPGGPNRPKQGPGSTGNGPYGGPISSPANNNGPYGAPIGPRNPRITAGQSVRFSSKVLSQNYEDLLALQAQQLDNDISTIKNQYDGPMSDLQSVLDDLASQGDLSAAAYARYSSAAAAIDPTVTTKGIAESDSPAAVTAVYDEAEAAVRDVLYKIDADLGSDAAMDVVGELNNMESFIQDALRTDLGNIDKVHAATGLAISRLAEAGYADNLYESGKSKAKLQAEIAKKVEDSREQLAKLKADMDAAIQDTRDAAQFDEIDLDYTRSKDAALLRYFQAKGLTAQDVLELIGAGDLIGQDPTASLNESNWSKAISWWNNENILLNVGLADDLANWDKLITDQLNVALGDGDTELSSQLQRQLDTLDNFKNTADIGGAFQGNQAKLDATFKDLIAMGAITESAMAVATAIGNENSDEWMLKDDDQFNLLRDLYTFERSFDNTWATIQADTLERANIIREQFENSVQGNPQAGHTAPNNWANRNTESYKYRAQVVAPYYANLVKATFSGTTIGGLGYQRDPSDVGGGRIVNSDHQSAGAIDVYNKGGSAAQTNAQLLKIAQWFRSQGAAVSYVTYEGKRSHQTGGDNAHVHVSFAIGYQIPGG